MPNWDQLYADKAVQDSTASRVLKENSHLLSGSGYALDYASGLGGNAKYLAQQGFQVIALDKSQVAIEKLNRYASQKKLDIKAVRCDLEKNSVVELEKYDVIIVSYYLHRETLPQLEKMLKKDGLLFYQTFSGPQCSGVGPSNPDFRLRRGELLQVFNNLELLVYHEAAFDDGESSMSDQVLYLAKK